jgi:hypothetical protein
MVEWDYSLIGLLVVYKYCYINVFFNIQGSTYNFDEFDMNSEGMIVSMENRLLLKSSRESLLLFIWLKGMLPWK